MSITVKKIVLVCPECGETINCTMDDLEFSVVGVDVYCNLECPSCGAFLEDEELV